MPPRRTIRAFIVGPTGVGKTDASIVVALRERAEIVSVDSRQTYRRLEIGTAKPTREQRALVRHHLVDILEPTERCSAGRFVRLFRDASEDLAARGLAGFAVGGAGLYVDACLGRLLALPPADEVLRSRYADFLKANGPAALHDRLESVDAETAARLAPRDTQRIVRALEVFELTGIPMSRWFREKGADSVCPPDTPLIHLTRDRRDLYARVTRRCGAMVEAGLPAEVRALLETGIPPDAPGLKTVGYAEWSRWAMGEWSREEAMESFVRNSRRYAKRQETWFRNRHPDRIEILIPHDEEPARTAERIAAVVR